MKRIIAIIIGIIIGIITIVTMIFGIVEKETNNYNANSKELLYSIDGIITNYQKITNLSKGQENVLCAISRGLVCKDADGNIVPDLAESYEEADNGIEYRFKLKDDIYWSDGKKITSKDICDFFKELIKYEDKENIDVLFDVYGVEKYKNGDIYFNDGVAIRGEDNTVIFRLNKPNNNFVNELTKIQYRIKKSLPLWSEIDKYYNHIVYSGYYSIHDYKDTYIRLISNNKNNNTPIVVVEDKNEETAMAAFEVGKRDIIINPPNNALKELNKNKELLSFPSTEGLYLIMNDHNNDLNLSTRMAIYKNLCDALKEYEKDNNMLFELSEGSYILRDKKDLTKLQTRKVSISSGEENISIKKISLCAIDNENNRTICKYISDWFNKKGITINIEYINEDDLGILNSSKYDLYLIDKDCGDNKEILFNELNTFFNKEEKDIYNVGRVNNDYTNLEENIFNNVRIVPVLYYKNSIGVSNNEYNILLDYYGNMNFSNLNKK